MNKLEYMVRKDKYDTYLVFPYDPANHGMMSIYAHVGQHCEASIEYIRESKPAIDEALVNEYKGILAAHEPEITMQEIKRIQWARVYNRK